MTGLEKAKTDPPSMGSGWDRTRRPLPFNDENKRPVPSGEAAPLKQGANGLSESKWASVSTAARGKGLATSTQWGPWATNPSDTNNSAEAVPRSTPDPILSKELKGKCDEKKPEAVKLAGCEVLKPTFAMQTAEQKKDQGPVHTSVPFEASSPKNLPGTEDMSCSTLLPQRAATNSRALAGVEFDDDGDVIMADLEEWRDIREVAHVIAEDRANERIRQGKPEVLAPGQRVDDATHIIVIDTSFILAHLSLVNDLVLSYMEWGCVVVLPWATIRELDGLKKSNRSITDINSQFGGSHVDISMLARAANRWAFQVLSKPEPGVWGQTREEVIDENFNHGDMAILDCARFFYDQGYDTYLLTNDFNLSVNAIIYKIKAFMYEKGQSSQSLLKKIYGRSQRPRHLPKPKGFLTQTVEFKAEQRPEKHVEPRIELMNEQRVDSGFAQAAGAKAITGTLPPNLIPGYYIPPMATRLHASNRAFSDGSRTSSPGTLRARQGLVGNGMAESIHAPRGREARDTKRATSYVCPTMPTIAAVVPTKHLSTLLLEIQVDALSSFRAAMKHHVLRCLGDQAEYLKIYPEDQIRSFYDLESFMLKHSCAVFAEFIPKSTNRQLMSRYFSSTLRELEKFSRAPGGTSSRPSVSEVLDFINALDSLWQMTGAGIPDLAGCVWPVHLWRHRANNDLASSSA